MSNLKLEDGFYWAEFFDGEFEIVKVDSGKALDTEGNSLWIEDFDFGPNPQPIPKPEWCK